MSGSTPIGLIPADSLVFYDGGFSARCLALAGFTWLVYDYFLTLGQEVSALGFVVC